MAKKATSKPTTAPAAKAAPAAEPAPKKTRSRRKKPTEMPLPPAPADHPELPGVTDPGVTIPASLLGPERVITLTVPTFTKHLERYREPQWRALLYVAHQYENSGGYLHPDCLTHHELQQSLSEGVTVEDIVKDLEEMGWVICDRAGPVPFYALTLMGSAVVSLVCSFTAVEHDWTKFRPFEPALGSQEDEP